MSFKKYSMAIVAAALMGLGSMAQAVSITIDDFAAGPVSENGPTGPTLQTGLGLSTLGGDRTYELDSLNTNVVIGGGTLSFSNNNGVDGILFLDYTSAGTDLASGGDNAISFLFHNADQPFTLKLTVNGVSQSQSLPAAAGVDSFVVFAYASFLGVDFFNVTSVGIEISPNNTFGGDYNLEIIETSFIPTPAALPAGLALMGAGLLRRGRRA